MPSSVIKSYQYNAEKETLTIVYVSEAVYKYLGVPPDAHENFKSAFSKGKYLESVYQALF